MLISPTMLVGKQMVQRFRKISYKIKHILTI